jgi:acetylornithine deacetylase/succinyl-diaminopimelate desuccinylase family protein
MIKKDRLLKLTQKVISYDSCNPPGSELELAKFIEKDMQSLKLDVKRYTYAKNRPNIVATLKGSAPRKIAQKKAVLLTPHFDTVPFGRGWKYHPLSGKIVGGKLYGRGASDDKGNLASCMEVMRSLVEDGFKPRYDVVMAATVDEETGSHSGIIPLLEKKVFQSRLAVVMDSSEFDAVIVQKGLIHARVQIFGKKAHGAYNWLGENALEKAAEVIVLLKKLKYPYKKHKLLHGPTMNIGVIHGGDKVNMVCDFCEFTIDVRYLPGTTHTDLLRRISKEISKVTKKFKIVIDDHQNPYEMSADHPGVKSYLACCRRNKCKAVAKGSEGATVITFFKKHNIPAFATGFAAHGTAHTTDEYIFVKSLYRGTQVLDRFVREYDRQ